MVVFGWISISHCRLSGWSVGGIFIFFMFWWWVKENNYEENDDWDYRKKVLPERWPCPAWGRRTWCRPRISVPNPDALIEGSGSVQICTETRSKKLKDPRDPEHCLEGALCGLLQGLVARQDGGHLLLYLLQLARVYLKHTFFYYTVNPELLIPWSQDLILLYQYCKSEESLVNWPPGSGSVLLFLRSRVRIEIGSLLFIQDLKEFQKKDQHFIIFNDILPVWQLNYGNDHKNVQVGTGSVINWHAGSGSVIQHYGHKDPDTKEISMDPQHWTLPDLA